MDRKEFLRKGLLGTGLYVASKAIQDLTKNEIDELKPLDIIGFNHIPNYSAGNMKNSVLHKANTRGFADHGWLKSYHSFSFANYYNPERMHFGVLRVLNDDVVAGGRGFGTHPHDNMEIISIPLEGDLHHKDSMGNIAVIKNGEIQVMSAGTGITHSEYNKNLDKQVKFLQIWLFPNKKNVTPRYDQMAIKEVDRINKFQQILSPNPKDEGVWIHQNAWFHLGKFTKKMKIDYTMKANDNGLYVFVIQGSATINGVPVASRDGFGVWNTQKVSFEVLEGSELLLMDVPMVIS